MSFSALLMSFLVVDREKSAIRAIEALLSISSSLNGVVFAIFEA